MQALRRFALPIVVILAAVAIGVAGYAIVHVAGTSTSNCQQIQKLDHAIYGVIKQSERVLGTKGSAGYDYYASHPTELAAARQQIAQELATFSPRSCQ